jgi:RNA polymerase sigma-70 factor (family 1)
MISSEQQQRLLARLREGEVLPFEEIYSAYSKKIYSFSYRYLRNHKEAEGVVQQVFLKLWENRDRMSPGSDLNAWLFTVTFNEIRKIFRKLSSDSRHLENYRALQTGSRTGEAEFEYFDLYEKASDLIEKLPPQQKKIFLLKREKGLTSDEMAKELGLSKKTVENHLNRARTFLRKAMVEQGLLAVRVWILV